MSEVIISNQASVATPSSGETSVYVDSTTKKLKSKDDTGAITDYSNPGNSVTSLTGDVTGTGPGATATSIASTVVTAKLLTGLGSNNGNVVATDSILDAFAKLNARNNAGIYGNGTDGDVTLTVDTTLVRDMYYNNLTVNSGVTLTTAGYRVFVLGTLNCLGTIDRSGASSSTNTGAAALIAGTVGASGAGGNGGGAAAGSAGGASATAAGTSGGAGGAGAGGAGGAAGTVTVVTTNNGGVETLNQPRQATVARDLVNSIMTGGSGGGGGGGSGVAGSGGGGGAGGGIMILVGRTITGNGTIKANGGNGSTAILANGGGGGGGGGGVVILLSENDTTMTSLTVQVNGGTAGAGNGTGSTGSNGSTGRIFRVRS
jgi:hypothetical protein